MADIEIISVDDLSSYPGIPATAGHKLAYTAERVNETVADAWANPTDPPAPWVKNLALAVAARFLSNPENLESVTASLDDGSKTRRFRDAAAAGIYLTATEQTRLAGLVVAGTRRRRVGSIRTAVPGYQP